MTGVVYGYSSVNIWGVLWGGATGSHVTGSYMSGSDVSHVTESKHQSGALSGSMFCACATESCAISAPVGLFDRKWRQSRDRKKLWPEVGSAHARIFPRAFFLVVVPWRPDATKGHLTPFGVPLGLRNGSCATPVVVVNNVGWGCSLWRSRPIIIGNPRVL